MWIQLNLPMEMPALFRKPRRVRRAKKPAIAFPWVQLEIKAPLMDLVNKRPGIVRRAWNWIKKQVKKWVG